ncbi:MAG: PQQ-binding-like beta-propeller repeat protein [Bryobacteraceae bacterium]
MIRILSILLVGATALEFPAFGADRGWPQFRGPDSNPVAAGPKLPDRWSRTENVEWSAAIPGRGWSSPIVTSNRVFLTTAVTEGESKKPQTGTEYSNEYAAELAKQGLSQKEVIARVTARDLELPHEVLLHYFLYCLDLRTGAVIWKREFHSGRPPGGRHRKNSFTSETPVTDGKAVYVYAANLGLWAFDLKGKQLWNTPLEANPIYFEFGTGASPVLNGNQLIIVSDNQTTQFVASFDKRTGKQLWRMPRDIGAKGEGQMRSGWATPYIWTNNLRTEVVTVGPRVVISYDLEGKELWRLSGATDSPVPSPFSYGGMLYVDGGRGRPLYAVRAGASGDISLAQGERASASVAWSEPRGGTYLPTPVAYRGALYVLGETGIMSRIDARTGGVTYRSRLDADAGNFTSSPWAYNGKIFCLSEEGKTFVVAAGEKFELLAVNPLDEMTQATPAITRDRLLLRTESRLYSIRGR